jgi:hypothetical protein
MRVRPGTQADLAKFGAVVFAPPIAIRRPAEPAEPDAEASERGPVDEEVATSTHVERGE